MTREFQVLYRFTQNPGMAPQVATGEVFTCLAMAEGDDQLRAAFEAAGFCIVAVNLVRAVVDWSLPNFNRDEAAEYMRIVGRTLSINKGGGDIPFATIGKGIYPRVLLERMVTNSLNPAGKRLLEQIEAAA